MANTFIPSPWETEAGTEVSQPGLNCGIKERPCLKQAKNIICCWGFQNSHSVVGDALSFWGVLWSSTELKSLWPLVSSVLNTKRLSTRFLIYLTIQGGGRQLPLTEPSPWTLWKEHWHLSAHTASDTHRLFFLAPWRLTYKPIFCCALNTFCPRVVYV